MAKAKKSKAKKSKTKKSKVKKSKAKKSKTKETVKRAAAASSRKAKKSKAVKRAAPKKAAPKKAVKKSAKPAKKAAPKKNKRVMGEGDYEASRKFLKDEAQFVKRHNGEIPQMGREAGAAMDGPQGAELRAAEEEAKSHSKAPGNES
jgi:hypothetical protein